MSDENPLYLPAIGDHQLRILSTNILELTLITTKAPDPAPVADWNFVTKDGSLTLPDKQEFTVLINNQQVSVQAVGFKRRVVYAPLKKRDLRIGNYLYLQLINPVEKGARVEVKNSTASLWSKNLAFEVAATDSRYSPAIHVNQVGYMPDFPKKAMVGYYPG